MAEPFTIYKLTILNMLDKVKEDIKPDYIVATFDRKAPTFRHIEYKEYKAGRKKMPEELAMQIPFIKEYLDVIGINRLELDDYEADDIVGTIATKSKTIFDEVEVISGDKDLLQLVGGNVKVFLTKKGLTDLDEYNESNFFEKLDFTPTQLIDYKGLVGDSSDNLPGIPGIGPKSAQRIILELKDKLKSEQNEEQIEESKLKSVKINENVQEAISGLMVLGYSKKDIEKAFEHLTVETLSVEELIRKGLILLSK